MQNTVNKLEKFYDILGKEEADRYFKEHWDLASTVSVLVYDFGWAITAQLLEDCSISPACATDYLFDHSDDGTIEGKWDGSFTDEFDGDYWTDKDAIGYEVVHNKLDDEDYEYAESYLHRQWIRYGDNF